MKRPRLCDFSRYRHGCDPPDPKAAVYSRPDITIPFSSSSHRLQPPARQLFLPTALAFAIVSGLVGCGSPASDQAVGLDSRTSATRGPAVGAQGPDQAPQSGLGVGREQPGDRDRLPTDQPAQPVEKIDGGEPSSDPDIPATIANDLSSMDPRDRYRALDYWEAQGTQAPLDPVFEAMEDEDEAVRAKATAIVEQYWAAEQEKEEG